MIQVLLPDLNFLLVVAAFLTGFFLCWAAHGIGYWAEGLFRKYSRQPPAAKDEEILRYWHNARPIPEGWELAADLEGTHHAHYAVIIRQIKP